MIYTIIVGETLTALADNVNGFLVSTKGATPVGSPFPNVEDGGWAQAVHIDNERGALLDAACEALCKVGVRIKVDCFIPG